MAFETKADLDRTDLRILRELQRDARMTYVDLGRAVFLSPPAAAERVRRLEECGIIEGYHARLSLQKLGFELIAILRFRSHLGHFESALEVLYAHPSVLECNRVTGNDCFTIKVALRSTHELEQLTDALMKHGVTETSIIISTPIPARSPDPVAMSLAAER